MILKIKKILMIVSFAISSFVCYGSPRQSNSEGKLEEQINNLVGSISELRQQIESNQAKLEAKKEQSRANINSLIVTKTELEKELSLSKKEITKINKENKIIKKDVSKNDLKISDLLPLFNTTCQNLKTNIEMGLPFKRKQRAKALDDICRADILAKNTPLNTTTFFKLWSFLEDEIRFSSEIILATSEITFDKKVMLAETVKVGSYAWFAKTPSDLYLIYNKDNKIFSKANKDEENSIRNLIIALKRNIRTGKLSLPLDKKTLDFIKS